MFKQDELKYDFDALEPFIDARTMEVHYAKHHAGYTKKFNMALEGVEGVEGMSAIEILKNPNLIPEEKRQAVINNGGGYVNHNLYWKMMTPNGSTLEDTGLKEKIDATFGGFVKLKEQFLANAMTVFGSGWGWLVKDNATGELKLMKSSFQNNPVTKYDVTPILTCDVWEHAYYLKHQNLRDAYLADWWNVIDWAEVANLYNA